jgi:hypothetical protein
MFNHLVRFIVGLFILTGAYFFSLWLFVEWYNKIFWVVFLIISYVVGYSIDSFSKKNNRKKY